VLVNVKGEGVGNKVVYAVVVQCAMQQVCVCGGGGGGLPDCL
jgi:hypothetical protein